MSKKSKIIAKLLANNEWLAVSANAENKKKVLSRIEADFDLNEAMYSLGVISLVKELEKLGCDFGKHRKEEVSDNAKTEILTHTRAAGREEKI